MKIYSIAMKLLTVILLTTACKKGSGGNGGNTGSEKRIVKGKITDAQARPLKNVSVIIDNTIIYNSHLLGTTGDDGTYKISLVNGSWMAYAEMNVMYNGKMYKINLHPDNNQGFGVEGAVRNFTWKLTGRKAEPMAGVYGGTIMVDKYVRSSIYDSENIEFTLTPVGALIDGSSGQVLKLKHGQPSTDTYGKLQDLPIGRYQVSAVYKSVSGNIPLKLRNKLDPNGNFVSGLQLDFEPTTSNGNNMAIIEYWED